MPGPDDRALDGASLTVPSHVVRRTFPRETVVLNLHSGKYHGLNATGARMLDALQEEQSVDGAVERLAAEYGRPREEVEADVRAFCSELLERGLVEVSERADG